MDIEVERCMMEGLGRIMCGEYVDVVWVVELYVIVGGFTVFS